jgi:hypothetical protein
MSYRNQIRKVTETYRTLDNQIKHLEMIGAEQSRIDDLRRRKLMFQNELSRLNKLQWEEDHERVSYDEDR